MYLSQLVLNPLNGYARKDLSNPYEMHRSLMRAFAAKPDEQERVLFRLEPPKRTTESMGVVLVQSMHLPDWTYLNGSPSYLLQDPLVKLIAPLQLRAGQTLRFRLRANPTKREAKDHKRIALLGDPARLAWLQQKGTIGGFRVLEDSVNIREAQFGKMKVEKKAPDEAAGKRVSWMMIHMVDFDGLLEVTDAERLLQSLAEGIGPAKGMGCGLLSLAKIE